MSRSVDEDLVRECYSTWGESYYRDYYGPDAAYPPVHRGIIAEILDEGGCRAVLDAGCGPASLLRDLDRPGRRLYGFDLTPEMVEAGRAALGAIDHPPGRVWTGSVTDRDAFRCPDEPSARFDAAVCCGVLPHVAQEDDRLVVGHLRDAVTPGGTVIVEARNALFALFTLNRYSWEFFRDRLIDEAALRAAAEDDEREALENALGELVDLFHTEEPPVRHGTEGEPGYDQVRSRTHDPLALADTLREEGLLDVRILHYHFHALPPMLAKRAPALARRASLAMEDPTDRRGLFMASAFLAVGHVP